MLLLFCSMNGILCKCTVTMIFIVSAWFSVSLIALGSSHISFRRRYYIECTTPKITCGVARLHTERLPDAPEDES